jgi:hypothetical protein
MTAVLHASFSFGHKQAGQLVYSYDPQGEDYADPLVVPAGSIKCLADALGCLKESAPYYNHSISFSFAAAQQTVPVTGRIYDEPGMLVVSLDFEPMSWQKLTAARRGVRGATRALLDAGRVLFTLLPLPYLLIGPSAQLQELPRAPNMRLLHGVPVALLVHELYHCKRQYLNRSLHVEPLPRGHLIVQHWDASSVPPRKHGAKERAVGGPSKTRSS